MKIARFFAAVAMLTATAFAYPPNKTSRHPRSPAGDGAANRGCPRQQDGHDLFGRFLDPKAGIARFISCSAL